MRVKNRMPRSVWSSRGQSLDLQIMARRLSHNSVFNEPFYSPSQFEQERLHVLKAVAADVRRRILSRKWPSLRLLTSAATNLRISKTRSQLFLNSLHIFWIAAVGSQERYLDHRYGGQKFGEDARIGSAGGIVFKLIHEHYFEPMDACPEQR